MEQVAVVGAGLMGHAIAQVFASAGLLVRIYDESPDVLASVHSRVELNLERLGEDTAAAKRITRADSLADAVRDAVFITEAIAENLELKQELFARLDELSSPNAVLATNTSVMSIDSIAARATNRSRIIGTHWWNPPYLIPLVEVTPGAETDTQAIQRAMELLTRVGKTPVCLKRDVPGFIGNRMQHALWREAIAIVDAGIADAEDVDRVVKSSFGLRLSVLGPLENADLVGLDLTKAIHDYILPHIDARPTPAAILGDLVAAGHLGMKSGRGFMTWSDEEIAETQNKLIDHLMSDTDEP